MQGRKVLNYTLLRLLGQGGMAEVWYAENQIGKRAAVKILNKELSLNEPIVERFCNEAKVTVQLSHPYIRRVDDYDEVDGRPCMVMEYLEGGDLGARMKGGERFTDTQLRKWWNQIVSALNYTHAQGIVHRDIKPSNIFITRDGDVKLLDFGIAKVRDSITATQTGATMGTPMYMSPELVCDSKRVDCHTDAYSLAVTFIHLLSGCAPYDFDTTDDFEIRENIVRKPLDLSKVPADWQRFLKPYLAKSPADRPVLKPLDREKTTHTNLNDTASFVEKTMIKEQRFLKKQKIWKCFFLFDVCMMILVVVLLVVAMTKPKPMLKPVVYGTMMDQDGNIYKTVKIGNQEWMAENLRTTHYADGTEIPVGNYATSFTKPYYYDSGNYNIPLEERGYLYNWPAVMHDENSSKANPSRVQGICPNGWHVPSNAEWNQLVRYVRRNNCYECGNTHSPIAKALASTTGWDSCGIENCAIGNNLRANNATGFSAFPAGNTVYTFRGDWTFFWSSTEESDYNAWARSLSCYNVNMCRSYEYKREGNSVRCVRD